MMEVVTVPPFERFYEEQQGAVLAQLRGMLGRDAADDAFQETFLRALRAYPTLEHGRYLRAWGLQIARKWALAALRRARARPPAAPPPPGPPAAPQSPRRAAPLRGAAPPDRPSTREGTGRRLPP